jgi:hypothetical protein
VVANSLDFCYRLAGSAPNKPWCKDKQVPMKTAPLTFALGALLLAFGCGDAQENPGPDTQATVDTGMVDVPAEDIDIHDPSDGILDSDGDGDVDVPPMDTQASAYFLYYAKTATLPGRFNASACDAITQHHVCVSTQGCNWLRTIKNNGVCRKDPVARCLTSGECACQAHDFHGEASYDDDLELFLPLSVVWQNFAPRTSTYGGGDALYTTKLEIEEIVNESMENFTSRTDFTHKTLTVNANALADLAGITEAQGLTLTMKFMQVWDKAPLTITGSLLEGLGLQVSLKDNQLSITVDKETHDIAGENLSTGGIKDYQCNQLALVVPPEGDATAYLGAISTTIPGLDMTTIKSQMEKDADPLKALQIGAVNAKVWDVRLYTNGRQLNPDELRDIGKRCGSAGDYAIPDGYPESNTRYSYGMGGTKVVPNHTQQHFSSGVYVTMWIPEPDVFPPVDPTYRDNLNRMIGFWDRWHEQMFFELDMIPFVDTQELEPEGSLNSYRNYAAPLCPDATPCGEQTNYNNPCRYVTDLFQAFNWLPEDFPDEPTSADHRKIAEQGGWTRWSTHDIDMYGGWQRPVHEHGHTAHFTLMRTYNKVHHYMRGIAGESFAEIMSHYVFTGVKSWMSQGLLYYPTIPISFEGRWDQAQEKHVFKSSQPYQEKNIDDQGLGARFYGLGVWWTFVSHYAAKPYLIGRLSGDSDLTPGTTLQKMRFYLTQEGLDLGDLFGNFAAHVATWDWPHIGHHYHQVEQDPFQGIGKWCTQNSGPDCTIDGLKVQADVEPDVGTHGEWVNGPADRNPGGFGYSTVRIASAPGGSLYQFSLDFDVPTRLYPDTKYEIGLHPHCRDDPRFFSSRIVVVDAGTEGQENRPNRPQYYKIPGRHVDKFVVRVPEGQAANIYLLAIPTPPFELEDVSGFVSGYSLTWPFRYKVTRLDTLPAGTEPAPPIILDGDAMLDLDSQDGHGFTYDCFPP